mgnify:CR=1 FL=1
MTATTQNSVAQNDLEGALDNVQPAQYNAEASVNKPNATTTNEGDAPSNVRQPLKIVWGWSGVKTDLNNRILNKKSYLSDWTDGFHWRVLAGMDNRRLFLHIAAL